MRGCTPTALLNFGVTGPKFTRFKSQNCDIAIRFGMPGLRIKVNSPILLISNIKLVAMATSLEPSEKRGSKSAIDDQMCTMW